MEGFFSKKETQSKTRPGGKLLTCTSCGKYVDCKSPKLKPTGEGEKGIMNIFSYPSDVDDRKGVGFMDKKARQLVAYYKEFGIDLYKDCVNIYSIACYSNENTFNGVEYCRKSVLKYIETYKPTVIVMFGDLPLFSVIGHRWQKDFGTIKKWQGYYIPDQELKSWLVPVFDLSFTEQSNHDVEELLFKKDLKKAVELSSQSFSVYKEPKIIYENDLSFLDNIRSGYAAFDYETTGIKPHDKSHKIICTSVATNENEVHVFMMPQNREEQKPWKSFLRRDSVLKIAQNMKFEDTWSKVKLGCTVNGWFYDTMIAQHVMDNREGVKGLKFQAFVYLGIIDYDSGVSPFLKSTDNKNANALNRIEELVNKPGGKEQLMKYCALDSIYEYRLAMMSCKPMRGTIGQTEISPANSSFPHAYQLLHDGILALAKAERFGLKINTDYCEKAKEKLNIKIGLLEKKIFESKFYRHWQHTQPRKVNLSSGDQLGKYLYGVRGITPKKLTESGKGSTDEEALELLNIPELNWILERTKLLKIRDTYLEAFVREQVDGVLHPFFNLHIARTYRSSSSNPNFQNIPKRDETAMKTVRKAIYPRPGHQLLEMDYSGIEVRIAACYHKDPTMIKYITDPTTDMHGDTASELFLIKDFDRHGNKYHKYLRSATKNSFIFPQFYGDYYKNCAQNVCSNWLKLPTNGKWSKIDGVEVFEGITIAEHLMKNGIKNYTDLENHFKKVEDSFWSDRFPVYTEWKERLWKQYLKNGYVSLKTGFVCRGVMRQNEVINFPVQGAAFHCLLWVLTQLTNELEEKQMDSKVVGQIHDAIVLDVNPDELNEVHEIVQRIGTVDLPEKFGWINVPLEIESELCPVDGSWAEKQEWKPE